MKILKKGEIRQIASNHLSDIFLYMWFTPCKAEQPLQGIELQEKELQKY